MGGAIQAIEAGWVQNEIAKSAHEYQNSIENKERKIIGVNSFKDDEDSDVDLQKINQSSVQKQIEGIKLIKTERDNSAAKSKLDNLLAVAKSGDNVMPAIIDAIRAECTLGEVADTFRSCFGEYQ